MASRSSSDQRTTKKEPRRARRPLRLFFSAIFAVFAVSSLYVTAAQTLPERARTEALARRAAERLQALQREADRLASDERTLIGDLRKVEIERQIKAEELRQVAAEHSQVATQLASTDAHMRQLQEEELAARPGGSARLVEIYKLGQG